MRVAKIIGVNPNKIDEYIKLHENVWPSVIDTLRKYNVENYSIFLKDNLLFAYLEYCGSDYASDMKKISADSNTKKWWKLTDPCQSPLPSVDHDEWWSEMKEVFHMD